MEWTAVEYLVNAFWQLPVLALGAWLLLRVWSPKPATQHRVWLAVLAFGLLLPLRGVVPAKTSDSAAELPVTASVNSGEAMASYDAVQSSSAASSIGTSAPDSTRDAGPSAPLNWFGAIAAAFSASVHRVSVSAAAALWIVGLWFAVALWGVLRIGLAWLAARRLVANSREGALHEDQRNALRECAQRVGVRVPEIRESDEIAGPVIVGAVKPVLLWPENFARTSGDEMRAALCHELAHVRRRDYGMNLLCEMAALPLKWHPATHGVERRIRATREMACDAAAAEAMDSEAVYAECLVRLARNIVGGGVAEGSLAAGLFNGNVMEERVMRLMRGRSTMSVRTRVVRGAAGAAAMLAAAAVAGAFHLTPAMAQEVPAKQPTPVQAVPAAPPALALGVSAVPAAPAIAPAVPAVTPAPVKLSPSISAVPVTPVALTPAARVVAKVPAAPLVPAIAAVVPVPTPMVAPRVNVQPPPPVPPQTHSAKPIVPQAHRSEQAGIIDGHLRELTPAERARVEKQLADAQESIAEATAKINSPEFRKQMEDAQAAALRAQTMLNSAEFKKTMADAQKQIAKATAKLNSPEFQKQLQEEIDATSKVNSAEFRRQMADAQKQIAAATARMNSPEFKRQIEDATRAAAKVNSAEFQKQMADAQKQIDDALARMRAEQEKDATPGSPASKSH